MQREYYVNDAGSQIRHFGESLYARYAQALGQDEPFPEDGYQGAYQRYSFCAVCELDDGWVTLLSEGLWPSEVVRRLRPAAKSFDVQIARPN